MRSLYSVAVLLGLGLMGVTMAGCQTDQPGATYTLNTYSVMVDSTPDKVTTAAAKAASDLKLLSINSSGTKVDGKVTAMTAQNTDVTIDIARAGDDVSKVSIRVGSTGDQALSAQLVDRIKAHLKWF